MIIAPRLLALCALALVTTAPTFAAAGGAPARAAASSGIERSEVRFQAKYKGKVYPIRRACYDEPAVVLPTGKVVRPVLDSMVLVPVEPGSAQTRPDWLYLDSLKAEHRSTTDINAGGSFNNELDLQFSVEAPKPLSNVFLVAFVTTQRGPRGLLVREVGDLAAFESRDVFFQLRLKGDFGAMHYQIYAFADGRELWHSLRFPGGFMGAVVHTVKALQTANNAVLPAPYSCFPPRGLKTTTGRVTVDVAIGDTGNVTTVEVDQALPDRERRKIAEAVRYWWFIPGRDSTGGDRFRIEIDLSDLKNWSEGSVRVLPREAAAAGA